jgi:hypothetical protein
MVGDSGAGSSAKIHPNIEAVGFVDFAQGGLTALHQVRHFVRYRFGGRVEFAQVRDWRNHQVATDVRIPIENDEIVFAAI